MTTKPADPSADDDTEMLGDQSGQPGAEYDAYRTRTWRLIPYAY
jgi:hypothetical protein